MSARLALEGADALDLFDVPADAAPALGLEDGEIVIDCFAGGGGASLGIEWATGRSPDEAINHSETALAIHAANHPATRHHHSDVWEVDPRDVARGRRVGLLWLSPDCTHFSRAKGGKPVSKKIRILAHVAVRYAAAVRPRVIILENVEEFLTWGPVARATGKADPRRRGHSFRGFVRQLRREGYAVEWRLLRGCDFGSPTSRRRLFLIARCDGLPVRWPVATHGRGRPEPWRTAAECIDFSLPCPSIFLTREEGRAIGVKRPLAAATMRRIARGVERFVLSAAEPFIVEYHSAKRAGDDRVRRLTEPLPTADTSNRFALVGAFLAKHYGDTGQRPGIPLSEPVSTITASDHHALVTSHLVKYKGTNVGQPVDRPLHTVQTHPHYAEVRAFLTAYYGNERAGGSLREPARTVTAKDRLALVTVQGAAYVIADIGMRMLTPRELARAQGFPDDYVLEVMIERRTRAGALRLARISKSAQTEMVGNSVNPHVARAVVLANLGAPIAREVAA